MVPVGRQLAAGVAGAGGGRRGADGVDRRPGRAPMAPRLVLSLVLGALLLCMACSRPVKSSVTVAPSKPEATVTAEELLDEYQKNEIAADQKYKGKLVQVSGKVTEVKKAPFLGYFV